LSIITVTSEQFTSKVRSRTEVETPIYLSILALYQQKVAGKS
ncbi:MAG: hypothetical protein JWL75_408, partial [Parcubacteria group bacterium]|nr:hypothetical protein [Parcubacteria group bacterium]